MLTTSIALVLVACCVCFSLLNFDAVLPRTPNCTSNPKSFALSTICKPGVCLYVWMV